MYCVQVTPSAYLECSVFNYPLLYVNTSTYHALQGRTIDGPIEICADSSKQQGLYVALSRIRDSSQLVKIHCSEYVLMFLSFVLNFKSFEEDPIERYLTFRYYKVPQSIFNSVITSGVLLKAYNAYTRKDLNTMQECKALLFRFVAPVQNLISDPNALSGIYLIGGENQYTITRGDRNSLYVKLMDHRVEFGEFTRTKPSLFNIQCFARNFILEHNEFLYLLDEGGGKNAANASIDNIQNVYLKQLLYFGDLPIALPRSVNTPDKVLEYREAYLSTLSKNTPTLLTASVPTTKRKLALDYSMYSKK